MIKSYYNDLGSSKKSFKSKWLVYTLGVVIAISGSTWCVAMAKDAYDLYLERETIIEEMGQLVGQNKVLIKKIEFGERTIRDLEAEIAKLDIENRKDAKTRDENRSKHATLRAELEGKQ